MATSAQQCLRLEATKREWVRLYDRWLMELMEMLESYPYNQRCQSERDAFRRSCLKDHHRQFSIAVARGLDPVNAWAAHYQVDISTPTLDCDILNTINQILMKS